MGVRAQAWADHSVAAQRDDSDSDDPCHLDRWQINVPFLSVRRAARARIFLVGALASVRDASLNGKQEGIEP